MVATIFAMKCRAEEPRTEFPNHVSEIIEIRDSDSSIEPAEDFS